MKTRARSLASRASLRVLILGSAALVACEARTPPPSTPRAESPKISATTEEVSAPTSSPTESTTSRPETATPPVSSSATSTSAAPDPEAEPLVALAFELPKPAFKGTPKHAKSDHLEPPRQGPRDPFLAPKGTKQLAKGAAVTSSDDFPIVGELELVTDGDKEAHEGSYLELGPGTQYVQIDLGRTAEIRAILLWQFHMNARIYHDVVVRVSDDPDFFEVTTLY
ncbi:MAG: hypothetical protein KDC38_10500, partial [Planctomycetes bacterium]|nr:hypothetical protein [Planctomycetota bacterium]